MGTGLWLPASVDLLWEICRGFKSFHQLWNSPLSRNGLKWEIGVVSCKFQEKYLPFEHKSDGHVPKVQFLELVAKAFCYHLNLVTSLHFRKQGNKAAELWSHFSPTCSDFLCDCLVTAQNYDYNYYCNCYYYTTRLHSPPSDTLIGRVLFSCLSNQMGGLMELQHKIFGASSSSVITWLPQYRRSQASRLP